MFHACTLHRCSLDKFNIIDVVCIRTPYNWKALAHYTANTTHGRLVTHLGPVLVSKKKMVLIDLQCIKDMPCVNHAGRNDVSYAVRLDDAH